MSTGFDAYPAHPSSSVEPPALGQRSETPLHPSSSATRDRLQRVLHLINGEHYAGAERVQDLLAACLPRFGYEVGFACVKPGVFPESRSARHIPLYRVPMQSRFDLRSIGRLCQIVDEGGYTLIHAHTPRTAIVGPRIVIAMTRAMISDSTEGLMSARCPARAPEPRSPGSS